MTDDRFYSCPMHPDTKQKGPGSCRICGMALEPIEVLPEDGPNRELVDMTRRFKGSLIFTVPLLLLSMSDLLPGMPLMRIISPGVLRWIELVLTIPSVHPRPGSFPPPLEPTRVRK